MFKNLNHKTFLVGGAVRDKLMGFVPKDLDYVIADTTEEEFRTHFPCEKTVPKVGENFPVFLISGNEVALARVEKSTGFKYQDFEVSIGVDIESDLSRRDFTFSSIAEHVVTGEIVDPFNGREDIKNKILKCVNPVAFKEDPLRIYRAARFVARFGFTIEEKTLKLMNENVERLHDVDPERVYVELKKMYEQSEKPSEFFKALNQIGGLHVHFAPLEALCHVPAGPAKFHGTNSGFDHTCEVIDRCKKNGYSFATFIGCLCHDFGKATTPKDILPRHFSHEVRSEKIAIEWLKEHRFTKEINKLVPVVAKEHMMAHNLEILRTTTLIRWYKRIKNHIPEVVQAFNCDHELNENQIAILEKLEKTFKVAKIDIPKETLKKGKEVVNQFVENILVKTYRKL